MASEYIYLQYLQVYLIQPNGKLTNRINTMYIMFLNTFYKVPNKKITDENIKNVKLPFKILKWMYDCLTIREIRSCLKYQTSSWLKMKEYFEKQSYNKHCPLYTSMIYDNVEPKIIGSHPCPNIGFCR